jgi:hypothetical protein
METVGNYPNYKLISFADGGLAYRLAKIRFEAQARESGLFSSIEVYDKNKILERVPNLGWNVTNFLSPKHKGYGYWLWKPIICLHELRTLGAEFDGILYVDIGCQFNVTEASRERLREYYRLAEEHGALTFELPGFIEESWTKKAALDYFQAGQEDKQSLQRVGGIIAFAKSPTALKIVEDWSDAALWSDFALLNDSLDEAESVNFRAHRHDQSLWSLASKQAGIPALADETYHGPSWVVEGNDFPIWAARLKGLNKSPTPSLAARFVNRILTLIP